MDVIRARVRAILEDRCYAPSLVTTEGCRESFALSR